jgi:O-antigen ligase
MTSIATMTLLRAKAFDRKAVARFADWLAVAVAVSLPWSTSATSILVALWLIAVLPTLNVAAVRRELATAAGGLPVALCALATLGLLWADAAWSERFGGYTPFLRLLLIPVLLAQFRRSEHGMRVILGFFASVTAVLLVSWLSAAFPNMPWSTFHQYGVPAKDYILQSDEFLMCALVLFAIAFDQARERRWRPVAGLVALGIAFIANIVFVVTARTTLLVAPALILLLGWRQFRWKGLVGSVVLLGLVGTAAALGSPYLQERLKTSVSELRAWQASDAPSSTALHLEFLEKSLSFVASAPVIGHGTGSIGEQFRNAAVGQTGAAGVGSVNPHNQIFAVAIQLGLVGVVVLLAMWTAHLLLFRGTGLISWIGVVIVVDNVVSSLVNSHLFDFTQAWLYIFGVGAAGGLALRGRNAVARAPAGDASMGWHGVPHGPDATSS